MKKLGCLLIALLIAFCGCLRLEKTMFTKLENGNLVSASGTEYTCLATEGDLYYLGELHFLGGVKGEAIISSHMSVPYHTGLYTVNGKDDILIRYAPHNEWFFVYRKSDLPAFDFSADSCIRMEFLPTGKDDASDALHIACNGGISDPSVIAEFLAEIRSQPSPDDAGLYDLVRKPDGMLENCFLYGAIYGFFADEPSVAIHMDVTSYNDLAYSVLLEGVEYVLPSIWLERLLCVSCVS